MKFDAIPHLELDGGGKLAAAEAARHVGPFGRPGGCERLYAARSFARAQALAPGRLAG